MSPTKSPTSNEVKIPCLSCGRECPDGLRFCLYCGGKTLEIEKPTMPVNPHCPECGQDDELNISFCIACGTKLLAMELKPSAAKFVRKTGFNWTLEDSPPPAIRMAMRNVDQPSPRPVARVIDRPNALIPILLGLAVGLLAAVLFFANGLIPYVIARTTWPNGGLVVYCPTDATGGMQLSLENLATHSFLIAPFRSPGTTLGKRSPGCLVFRELPAGDYMIRMQKGGSTAAFGLVTLAQDRPTVLGYPNGIQLPSNQASN